MIDALREFADPFNFAQINYVTNDVDEAVMRLKRTYGIPEFSITRGAEVQTAKGPARIHGALAFAGGRQIEVLQPAGGADGVYRDWLPRETGFALRHHHYGHLITSAEDWQRVKAIIRAKGWDTPVGGNYDNAIEYLYVDVRHEIGHYLEFMYHNEKGMEFFRAAPGYTGN